MKKTIHIHLLFFFAGLILQALLLTAAPLGTRTLRKNWFITDAADRAFPATVTELDR